MVAHTVDVSIKKRKAFIEEMRILAQFVLNEGKVLCFLFLREVWGGG